MVRNVIIDDGRPVAFWEESTLGDDKASRGMGVSTQVCSDPECPWVHLDLTAVEEEPRTTCCRVRVHAETAELVGGDAVGVPGRVAGLLEQVERLVTSPGSTLLEILQRRWRNTHGRGREGWRTEDWSGWGPGQLVAYHRLYPDEPNLLFHSQGQEVWADDSYCLTAGCDCNDVLLDLSCLGKGGPTDLGRADLDLQSGTLRDRATGRQPKGRLQHAWRDLLAAHPDLRTLLKRRREDALRIAPTIRALAGDTAPIQTMPIQTAPIQTPDAERAGRNDPCPCGSGRKYKRCCR